MTDFSGPGFLNHLPKMCPTTCDVALFLHACWVGWGIYMCIVIKDQNKCDRIYFPSAFSLLCCLPEGNNACVWIMVWGGWRLVKLPLHIFPVPPPVCSYHIGTYGHAVDGGDYQNCECLLEGETTNCKGFLPGKMQAWQCLLFKQSSFKFRCTNKAQTLGGNT